MNIHEFNSFLGSALDIKLKSNNKRSIFNVLDKDKDGYCKDDDFVKVFSLTKEEIDRALADPHDVNHMLVLDMIIEQLYHEVVYFNSNGIGEIQKKLDKHGMIGLKKLEKQLSFYKVELTAEERGILEIAGVPNELTGEKFIPFRRLVESTISKANINISFKLGLIKQGTFSNAKLKEQRLKEMETHYEEEARRKAEEEERKRKEETDGDFSEFEESEDMDTVRLHFTFAKTRVFILNIYSID